MTDNSYSADIRLSPNLPPLDPYVAKRVLGMPGLNLQANIMASSYNIVLEMIRYSLQTDRKSFYEMLSITRWFRSTRLSNTPTDGPLMFWQHAVLGLPIRSLALIAHQIGPMEQSYLPILDCISKLPLDELLSISSKPEVINSQLSSSLKRYIYFLQHKTPHLFSSTDHSKGRFSGLEAQTYISSFAEDNPFCKEKTLKQLSNICSTKMLAMEVNNRVLEEAVGVPFPSLKRAFNDGTRFSSALLYKLSLFLNFDVESPYVVDYSRLLNYTNASIDLAKDFLSCDKDVQYLFKGAPAVLREIDRWQRRKNQEP